MQTIIVPEGFRPRGHVTYPAHQRGPRMEEAVCDYMARHSPDTSAVYLPVLWDTYLVDHGFGRDVGALQRYVDSAIADNRDKMIWTVCEYADGIKVNIDNPKLFHVMYCARSGGTSLPLLCDAHPVKANQNRGILASFVGAIDPYAIRRKMRASCSGHGFVVKSSTTTAEFCDLMANSKFALCPRGYGPTSYRLYEAIQMGCVPVYIYDEPHLPFESELDWGEFCVLVHDRDIPRIPDILNSISHDRWMNMKKRCEEVYQSHFNMRAVCEWVSKYLESRWHS